MAAIGFTPISLYYSATAAAVPVNTNLVAGELAINTVDGKLFYKDSSNVVQVLATKGGIGSSATTQVLYNSGGLVVGSANLTFNGTVLSASSGAFGTYATIGSGANTFFADATNTALRPSSAGGAVYFQSSTGSANWANVSSTGLSVTGNILASSTYGTTATAIDIKNTSAAAAANIAKQAFWVSDTFNGLVPIASIEAVNPSASANTFGNLIFRTTNAGTTLNEVGRFTNTGLAVTGAISATGNVGVGANAAGYKLSVTGSSGVGIGAAGNTGMVLAFSGAVGGDLVAEAANISASYTSYGTNSAAALIFATNGGSTTVERMRLDFAGNLGLGITPSAWGGGYKSYSNGLYGEYYSTNGGYVGLSANAYYNGTNWIAKNTPYALRYEFDIAGGQHRWFNSNGVATGSPLTFTQAMTLDASGNLGVGTASPIAKLDIKGGGSISTLTGWNTLSNSMFELANPAVRFGIGYDSNDQVLLQAFDSSNTARSLGLQVYGGNVGIGTATPAASAILDAQSTTKGVRFPNMTTTQKTAIATPATGLVVYDTTVSKLNVYTGSSWGSVGGGATGGGADTVFVQNSQAVTTSYTITAGQNASSVGPITIPGGVIITVPTGARWVIL